MVSTVSRVSYSSASLIRDHVAVLLPLPGLRRYGTVLLIFSSPALQLHDRRYVIFSRLLKHPSRQLSSSVVFAKACSFARGRRQSRLDNVPPTAAASLNLIMNTFLTFTCRDPGVDGQADQWYVPNTVDLSSCYIPSLFLLT